MHPTARTTDVRRRPLWNALNLLIALAISFAGLLAQQPGTARAAIRTVAVGGSLQTAVNNSQPGDVIRLAGNTQANENVNLALMGSAVGSSPGNLTIVGVNGAAATLLGGNGTRIYYSGASPFPGTLTLDGLTLSTSAATTVPALSLQNMGSVFLFNVLIDGVGAEGCASGSSGCTGFYYSASSGSPTLAIYSSTFRNIASDAIDIDIGGSAQASVAINTSLITDNGLNAAVPNTGVQLTTANTSTAKVSIAQVNISNLEGSGVFMSAGDTSILSTSVVSNSLANLTDTNNGAITISTASDTSSPTVNAIVADNTISTVSANAILAQLQSTGPSASFTAQIRRNTINGVDTASSKRGILALALPTYTAGGLRSTFNTLIENNNIQNTGGAGIFLQADDVSAAASIRNNVLAGTNQIGDPFDSSIAAWIGANNSTNNTYSFSTAILGNTVNSGIYLEQDSATAPLRVESTGDPTTYLNANNTFTGGTTTKFGTLTGIALNTVARPAENQPPGAFRDQTITVASGVATPIDVLANDRDIDVGDTISLLSFQPVSTGGGAITRDDNGTPANQADDKLIFTSLAGASGLDRFFYTNRDPGGRPSVNYVVVNVVVDSTPPDTTITTTPSNPTSDSTPTFQFTGTDNVTAPASLTFECRFDAAAFAACTSPFTAASLADGSHTFEVRAKDQAGNVDPTPASYTFVVDATAPNTTITATPANPSSSTSASFSFSGSDAGSGVVSLACSLDGATFTTCTSPQSYTGLAEGSHTFQVRATDNTGNVDPTPASYTWVVDVTAPDTTITANPPALTNSANASFSFTGSDVGGSGVASFECSLDSGAFGACTSPKSYTSLTDGPHSFQVRAIDSAGNVDATPASFSWTVDTTAPPAPVVTTPANGSVTNNPLPPVTGTAEAGSTVTVLIDGTSVGTVTADGSGNFSYTPSVPLSNGAHTVKARASDSAGNVGVDSNTNSFTVDTVEPDTTFTATPPSATNSTTANFSFTGNGTGSAVARFECSLDGAAFATCTSPQALSGLAEGTHTFRVRAVDTAGNTETTPASYTWVVDLTAPDTTITASPPALSNSASATFSFTGSDPTSGGVASGVASFECSLDSGAFGACTSPKSYTGLADGPHSFQVRAIDSAGNVDATPASFSWTVDTTAPPAPVVTTPANGSVTNNPLPPVTGTAEPNSTVTIFFDGSSVGTVTADGSGNFSYTPSTPLADGAHTVKVRASDSAGNTSVDSATNTFTVDTTQPDTTFSVTPPAVTTSTTANFSFTGNGTGSAISKFECSLDGAAFATCTSPQALSSLAEGTHTFQVRATDAAGNLETTPASYVWIVDLTAPDTTITASPPALSSSSNASFSFTGSDPISGGTTSGVASFECSLDGGAFTACTSPKSYTGLTDGPHSFQVRAIDNAGNVDATPASYSWTIDTTAPPAPVVTTPANGSVTSNTQPVASGTAEPGSSVTVRIDGTSVGTATADASGNWSLTLPTPLADGSHTVRANASDAAGNASPNSNTNTFIVDTTQPDTTITAQPANPTSSASASFSFTASDGAGSGIAGLECSLDGAPFAACSSPAALSGLADGSHTFQVRATDNAGNVETTPASYTWVVDTAAPDTTITSSPAAQTNSTSAAFAFTGSDAGGSGVASFECSLDAGAFAACTSPQSYTGLADGPHSFAVRAIDAAGNVDATPAAYSWTIDTAPLSVTINQAAGQSDPAATAPIAFTVVFGKPVADFTAKGVDLSASTAPGALTASVSGSGTTYTVTVSGMTGPGTVVASITAGAATDASGNASQASTSTDNSVTFSPATPVVTGIVRAGANPTNAATVTFNVTFSEAVTGVDAADFTLATTGLAGASVTGVSGSGTTYAVTVSTGSGDGTVGLSLVDDDSIASVASGIALGGSGAANGDFAGQAYDVDKTAPTAQVTVGPVAPGAAFVTITVAYADNVALSAASLGDGDVLVTGPGGFSAAGTLVGSPPVADGTPVTLTYRVAAPGGAWDAADNGAYTVTVPSGQVLDTAGNSAATRGAGFNVQLGYTVALPLVVKQGYPDLVITQLRAAGGDVVVTVRNQGSAPATAPFWVELYVAPTTAPTHVNQLWYQLGGSGAVWGVTGAALPLAPGASLTLRIGDQYYRAAESSLPASLAAGTPVYAQVDSWNAATSYGAVLETHEAEGGAYNNIASATVAPGGAALPRVTTSGDGAAGGAGLPERPAAPKGSAAPSGLARREERW